MEYNYHKARKPHSWAAIKTKEQKHDISSCRRKHVNALKLSGKNILKQRKKYVVAN